MARRILRDHGAVLSVTFYDDETAVDADGSVSVTITNADGSVLVDAASATKETGSTGVYTYSLNPQADLAHLTLAWTGSFSGSQRTVRTFAEVVGAHLFHLAELRASDSSLSSETKYPTEELSKVRDEVTDEFERITGRSFIPRYRRVDPQGSLLPDVDVHKVLKVDGKDSDVEALPSGVLSRPVKAPVGYEYGFAYVPADILDAALLRARARLQDANSGIPDRATSFTHSEGGTFRLATAGQGRWQTGIPDVDAVLARYKRAVF